MARCPVIVRAAGRAPAPSRNMAPSGRPSRPTARCVRRSWCRARRRWHGRRRPARAKAAWIFGRLRPTFMITAASQPLRRVTSRSSSSVPGSTVRTSSPWTNGVRAWVQHPLMPETPGTTSLRYASAQPIEQIHRGAVEERIAFAQQRHVQSGIQPARQAVGAVLVEAADGDGIARIIDGDLGGERIFEPQLLGRRVDAAFGDAARMTCPAALGEECDHRGGGDDACRLQGHQLRIARPEADDEQRARPSLRLAGQRVDRRHRHRAAALAASHDQEWHPPIGRQRLFGLGGADETRPACR